VIEQLATRGGARQGAGERRRELLQAAHDLIVERGFEGLRVRDIAARVGINNATLHHYFPTKEALVRAMVEAMIGRLDRIPAPGSAPDAPPPRAALRAYFAHALGEMRAAPDRFVVLNELAVRAARDAAVRRILASADARWRDYLVRLLEAGVVAGEFRADLAVPAAAEIIAAYFAGLALRASPPFSEAEAALAELERWIAGPDEAR
jgi:AcrR family transcriptional regulator